MEQGEGGVQEEVQGPTKMALEIPLSMLLSRGEHFSQ